MLRLLLGLLLPHMDGCLALQLRQSMFLKMIGPKRGISTTRSSSLTMGLFDYMNPLYWKQEYVVAATLANQIPASAAIVMEMYAADGKRFFYYPDSVVQVVVSPPLSERIGGSTDSEKQKKEEKALLDAGARARKSVIQKRLAETPSNTIDAVVMVAGAVQRVAKEGKLSDVSRVLKPGGRLVFVEKNEDVSLLDAVGDEFESVQLIEEQDGYAVGYAIVSSPSSASASTRKGNKNSGLATNGPNRRQRRDSGAVKSSDSNSKKKKRK